MKERRGPNISIGRDGEPKLCVGRLPGRKRPALWRWDPTGIDVLATFRDDASAEWVDQFFQRMIGAHIIDGAALPPNSESDDWGAA